MDRPTILIADDEPAWHQIIAEILAPNYLIVAHAYRGDEALQYARKYRPDAITLDISMPGQSGLRILPELRSALPNTTIVIVTTTQNDYYLDEAFKRGADAYVIKGKLLTDLLPVLRVRQSKDVRQRQLGS